MLVSTVFKMCYLHLLMTHDFMPANARVVSDQKELDDSVCALRENRLPLHKLCMEGTRTAILRKLEEEIRDVDGHNVIWITNSRLGRKWTECIDKEWLRELEKRKKVVGNLLE